MKNWAPLANVEGAAHCFAISLMTTLFNKRILFTRDRAHKRVKLDKSWGRGDLKKRILETDEIGLHLIFEYLTTYDDGGRLQVGGFEGLQAFTSPGAIGEEFFLRNSEAIQFLLQIVAMGHRYAGTLIFSNLGSLPFSNVDDKLDEAGRKAILRRAYGKIKERIQEEELAPFTMHPSKIATDGHVIVAYKVRESGDQAELHCYDSNYPPEQGKARPTIVHLDLAEGTYRVLNHKGEKKYTRYDLLTFIDPNGRVIRHLARETVQHLDKATEATNLFYATLEVASRKGLTPLRNQEFVEDWKKTKERFKKNSTRRVRWSINFSR